MVDLTVIDVPPMPILQMIPPFKLNETLKSPVWTTMGEIKNFELNDLPAMDYDDTPVWGSHAGHISWSSLIVLLILTVLLIYCMRCIAEVSLRHRNGLQIVRDVL